MSRDASFWLFDGQASFERQAQGAAAWQIDRFDSGQPPAHEPVTRADVGQAAGVLCLVWRWIWCLDRLPEDDTRIDEETVPDIVQSEEKHVRFVNEFATVPVFLDEQGVAHLLPDVWNRIMKGEHVVVAR